MTKSPLPAARWLAVIPARNEAPTVGDIVRRTAIRLGCDVMVVSDDSTDGTVAAARAAGARVLELPIQLGAWGATQAGMRYAQRHRYDGVITLDADGQHDPDCLPALCADHQRGDVDVVIGTFPQRLSGPKKIAWKWFRGMTGLAVEDLTSGLRVYGSNALRVLASSEATLLDYQDVGVLLLLRKYGLSVREVPATMFPRSTGHSRVFSSWFTVAGYMIQTTLLCIARFGRMGGARATRRAEGLNS